MFGFESQILISLSPNVEQVIYISEPHTPQPENMVSSLYCYYKSIIVSIQTRLCSHILLQLWTFKLVYAILTSYSCEHSNSSCRTLVLGLTFSSQSYKKNQNNTAVILVNLPLAISTGIKGMNKPFFFWTRIWVLRHLLEESSRRNCLHWRVHILGS